MNQIPDDMLVVFLEHDKQRNLIIATNEPIGLNLEVKDMSELETRLKDAIAECISGKDTLREFGFSPDVQPVLIPKIDTPMSFSEFATVFGGRQTRNSTAALLEKLASGDDGIHALDEALSSNSQLDMVALGQALAKIEEPKAIQHIINYTKTLDDMEKPMMLFGMLPHNQHLLHVLLDWFNDTQAPNRRNALIGLGYFQIEQAKRILSDATNDPDPTVAELAQSLAVVHKEMHRSQRPKLLYRLGKLFANWWNPPS